jgi:hypothetical protein
MEFEKKPRRLRIVTGTVAEVEEQLNQLLDSYLATQYNYAVVGDELRVTVVLLHESVVRMHQIAQAGAMRPN